ncbi:GIY-YIG nuclease family protein [Jannaschia sp. LMIT008]|uniref:GIY-YIG nuclease family protein n=1 Tax=Jannaschia maritima TaxID=3032585 RepID=UPI0028116FDC|nr:GIY-YIG nuclease family protein [Jannaschia sp. LMIT008]
MTADRKGFVYVMRSPSVTWSKIGRSERAPHFRAKELTNDAVYGQLGPWEVVDYRHVIDMYETEATLHRHYDGCRTTFGPARELFDVPVDRARETLIAVSAADLVKGDVVGRLRWEGDLARYLLRLFRETGLSQFLDLQEAWTLSVFTSTPTRGRSGGRLFTLNVGTHEVAFAKVPDADGRCETMLFVDELVWNEGDVRGWFERHGGGMDRTTIYASRSPRGLCLRWHATLTDSYEIFDLPMMRRGLIAYWYDRLLGMRDAGARSLHARHHNHNAVQELLRLQREGIPQ